MLLFGVLVYPPVFLAAVLGFRNFGLLFIFIHSLVDCFILIITFYVYLSYTQQGKVCPVLEEETQHQPEGERLYVGRDVEWM